MNCAQLDGGADDIVTSLSGTMLINTRTTQVYHREINKIVTTTRIWVLFSRRIRFIVARILRTLISLMGRTYCNSLVGLQINITSCINLSRVTMQGLKTESVRRPACCTAIISFQQQAQKTLSHS
jgi:hypothetical protein